MPRRWLVWWLLIALLSLPSACAPIRHEFSDELGVGGDGGTNTGGTANAGRAAIGGNGHMGGSGTRADDGGQAGEPASSEGGSGAAGGTAPTAGTGPSAGSGGSNVVGGAGGSAPIAGSGGSAPTAGSGGSAAIAGAGGTPGEVPTIVDTTPAADADGVHSDQTVVVVFSQPMNKAATEAAFDPQSLPAGTFSWSTNAKTMTYTPSSALVYATGTAPDTTQAKLYSYQIRATAQSAVGVPLGTAKTFGFFTSRQIALTLTPTEVWSVNSIGSGSKCLVAGSCVGVPVGDDAENYTLHGVFRYALALPQNSFVQDVQMSIGILFSNGNTGIAFGLLQVAKTATIPGATTITGSSFNFTYGAIGATTTSSVSVPGLISNGSLGATNLYVAVQYSIPTDSDGATDNITISDGHLLVHYLLP